MADKNAPQYTTWQLGLLVVCGIVGMAAMGTSFFVILALPETPTLTLPQGLCIANAILGLTLWSRSMQLLHRDLRKRWMNDPSAD